MAIEFDGKGNIVGTTPDGVIAVKLYSLEKQIDELKEENDRLEDFNEELMERLNYIKEYIRQIRIDKQKGIVYSYNSIEDNLIKLCEGKEIIEGEKK